MRLALRNVLSKVDDATQARVRQTVRTTLEELAKEQIIDPASIDEIVQTQLEEMRAARLLHGVAGDVTLCYVKSVVPDPDTATRFEVRFSVPQWIVEYLDILHGTKRIFEPQDIVVQEAV